MFKSLLKYSPKKYEMGYLSDSSHNFSSTSPDRKLKNRKINPGRISRFNTVHDHKQSNTKKFSKNRRRSLIGLTIMDKKNIEEEIKNKILEMKYNIQMEIKQIYGDSLFEKFLNASTSNNEKSENSENNGNNENNEKSENKENNENEKKNENFNKTIEKNILAKNDKEENNIIDNEFPIVKTKTKYFNKEQEKENINKIERKIGFDSLLNNTNLNRNNSLNTSKDKERSKDKNRNTIINQTPYKLKKTIKPKYNRSVTIRNPSNFNSFFLGKIKYFNENFRKLTLKNKVCDSQDDDETDEEQDVEFFVFSPESDFILYFDVIIFICILYSVFYTPLKLAKDNSFCENDNNFIIITKLFIDIFYIIDFLISFFRGYYTKDQEKLVTDNIKIIKNYLTSSFLSDLIEAYPFNSHSYYICKNDNNIHYSSYDTELYNLIIHSLSLLKAFKISKILRRNCNQFITRLKEKLSTNVKTDNIINLLFQIFTYVCGIHIMACFQIYIGKHNFPNWIIKNKFENYSFCSIYVTSVYFLITTVTTVGYGDISLGCIFEIFWQVILLGGGIIIYSWLISSIGNGINKQSYASINYANESKILEEIRITHPNLSYKTYQDIRKFLEFRNFHPKKNDKNILLDNLPYMIRNELVLSM